MTTRFSLSKEEGDQIPDSQWELFEISPTHRRYRAWIDDQHYVEKTELIDEDALIDLNQEQFKASETKRWGDGKVAARIPMNVFFKECVQKIREGDTDHLKWFLNHEDCRPYRTFKGRI